MARKGAKLIWPDDFINKIICGDCLEILSRVPSNTIDMCLTSPPYWGLRDYEIEGQLGLEKTSEEYIEKMTAIFHEIKRVLKKEGTLWLNIGDTYFGSGCGTNDYRTPASISISKPELYDGPRPQNIKQHRYLKPKSLCMIPERLAWALIQDGWILRNKIIWHKPNPMPASVKDRFNNTWEYVYLFAKSKKYYFDLDAVREPHSFNLWSMSNKIGSEKAKQAAPGQTQHSWQRKGHSGYYDGEGNLIVHPLGKNPGDFFEISIRPFPDAHFSVFPKDLCEKPIKAGCPEEICKKCGKARERIIKPSEEYKKFLGKSWHDHKKNAEKGQRINSKINSEYITSGWTSCNCNAGFEGGIILDPFCGAGTALFVAKEMRRRYIGIDIKQEYVNMSKKRLAQGVL